MTQTNSFLERCFSLTGKTALITGASGGIGHTLAVALAEAGAAVGVHGRNRQRTEETCRAVEAVGVRTAPLIGDIETVEQCRALIAETHAALGRLDILINCAATNRRKPMLDATQEDFDAIVAINLRAPYFLSQAAHPYMAAQGGGKIIHIGSINSFYGLDNVSVYGLSKGGLAQLTKVMAVEWARDNIQVNCLTPGFFLTPLTEGLWSQEERARWFRMRIPVRRPGTPDELVGAMLLLAGPASSYITGQNIVVDGGFLAGGSWLRDNELL